ncbi:hypothetical protein [Halorientalis pallida]|uniref:Rad51-like C-terminal domain-containing protein n=1 Tax=Halorientalis pallida TaxID=2479928 RepID=A0A498KUI7_9EURY|nr:hypothetical protein [Halorientalis pallida]RXK48632.1 hypothetical protein EAF64_13240 [Halorientalis pallida]
MDRTRLPELPTLDPGVQLLATDGQRAGEPLRALVLDHALGGGQVRWVDSRGYARTDRLARLAPDPRALDRIRIARGFTAHQHVALVRRLPDVVTDDTALVVLPAMDAPYRADDVSRGRDFLLRSLATVARVARDHAVPVLVTRTGPDGLGDPLAAAADHTVECRQTAQGPRFVTDDFETLVYPQGDGTAQTTLAFCRRVLAARAPAAGDDPARHEGSSPTEVTVDGAY